MLVLDRGLEEQGARLAAGVEALVAALGGVRVPVEIVGNLPAAELVQAKLELGAGRGIVDAEGDLELSLPSA